VVFYSGWVVFGSLLYSFFFFPSAAIYLNRRNWRLPLAILSPICVLCSGYLVYVGLLLIVDWSNPFAEKGTEVARAVHNPKGWFVVAAIVIWPYLLIGIGVVTSYIGLKEWRRALSISN
jgi:hypothetical protein